MSSVTDTSTSRQRLVTAMAELLWEKGYAATSPRDVMSATGVGQGSFYHHFSGKHDLAVEAIRANGAAALAGDPAPSSQDSALTQIEERLLRPRPGTKGCRVGRMTQDPKVVEDPEMLDIIAGAFDTMRDRWETLVSSAVDRRELPADTDVRALCDALAAVIQGGYVLARARGSQEPMDSAIRGMVALLDAAASTTHHTDKEQK